jgi:hypothetical protein
MSSSKSESIAALAAALSKAQGEIKGAIENAQNPHFRSSYADLASIWDACRSQLSKNQLAVVQTTEDSGENVSLVTTLLHSSGEWISGKMTLKPIKADPQGIGSALTYARRYALAAIVGVAPIEDDDGEASQGRGFERQTPAPRPAPSPGSQPNPQAQAPAQNRNQAIKPAKNQAECAHDWAPSQFREGEEYCRKRCGAKRQAEALFPQVEDDLPF